MNKRIKKEPNNGSKEKTSKGQEKKPTEISYESVASDSGVLVFIMSDF